MFVGPIRPIFVVDKKTPSRYTAKRELLLVIDGEYEDNICCDVLVLSTASIELVRRQDLAEVE